METRSQKMFCCAPEMCIEYFQRLNAWHANRQTKVKDETGQEGRKDGSKDHKQEGRNQPPCTHKGKTAGQDREEEGKEKEERSRKTAKTNI